MKNIKRNQFIAAVVLFGALSIGIGVWVSAESYMIDRVHIENKTRSLIVESIINKGDFGESTRFQISVKNSCKKPIVIYRIRVRDEKTDKNTMSMVERSGLADGWTLKPDEVSTLDFAAAQKGDVFLTIAAVLFADGTGEGDEKDLTQLKEIRAGIKMAYEKIVPILKQAAKNETNPISDEILQSVQDEIKRTSNEAVPMNSRSGFAQATNFINFEIDNLRKIPASQNIRIKEEFENFQTKIEKILSSLSEKTKTNSVANKEQK